MAALDDSPRPGREPVITDEARTFVVDLACRKAKDLGYPHELWTTRLLTEHVREHGPAAGHACLANLAQGTLCKILAAQEIKPHKVRYYLERRDPDFDEKMAEVLCVYREVELLKQAAERKTGSRRRSRSSPTTKSPASRRSRTRRPTCRPRPCAIRPWRAITNTSDMGTLSLLAGIDLLTGVVHASVEERHRSREFVAFLQTARRRLSARNRDQDHPRQSFRPHIQGNQGLARRSNPKDASPSYSRPSTAPGSTSSRASSPSSPDPCFATSASPPSRNCKDRIIAAIDDINRDPVVHTWTYKINEAA